MTKVGRNQPCPCGSGKKYKKCCLAKDEADRLSMPPIGTRTTASESGTIEDEEFEEYDPEPLSDDEESRQDEEEDDMAGDDADSGDHYADYPDPPEVRATLPPTDYALVIEWWTAAKQLFGAKQDADAMLTHLTRFMDRHPRLVTHLELENEYLFELAREFGFRREWSRYADLLLRLREQCPEAYVHRYGDFDYDLIVEQLVQDRPRDVTRFFKFFHQYPNSETDNAEKVIDLLAWTGLQDALFEFVKPLPPPPGDAPDAPGDSICSHWLGFARYVPFLDARADPQTAARELIKTVNGLAVRDCPYIGDEDSVAFELRRCMEPPGMQDFKTCRTHTDVETFYCGVSWNFRGFLHASPGFPWVKAHALAMALERYWLRRAEHGRPRDPFPFSAEDMETFICQECRYFLSINGVRAVSFLEAAWHFVDYLLACGFVDESVLNRDREMLDDLFQRCLPTLEVTDPAPRLMPEFPKWTIGKYERECR